MGLDFSCFGDTTNCDINFGTIKVPEIKVDPEIPTVELPKSESSDLVIKDTFLPLELTKLPPQGCLILKYFKNPYRCKSGQICKVMSQ
jgi:hypothetical protein